MSEKAAKRWRLTARIIGTIVTAFWLMMGLGYLISGDDPYAVEDSSSTIDSIFISAFIIIHTIALIIAYRKEKIGGMVFIISGTAMSIFAYISAGTNKMMAITVSGVPFIIIGLLFLLSTKIKSK